MMAKSRIIHVATGAYSVPPTGAGGVEMVIYSLTQHQSRLGCDVGVIDIKSKTHQEPGSTAVFHEVWDPPLADKGFLRHLIRVLVFALLAFFKLRRLVKSGRIDIVHTHSQFPAAAVLLANRLFGWNIPHLHTTHNHEVVMRPALINRLKHILEVIVLKKATHVVALTDTIRRQLVSKFGVDSARITVIPNGTEVEDITEFRAQNPRPTGTGRMVLCPARICTRKNQLVVLQAAPAVLNLYPETKFIFAGPIDERSYFNNLSKFVLDKNLSQAVEFAGEVSRERLYELYQKATVFALPTLYEMQGLVVIEAMSFGVPVIASRIGPIEDTVKLEEGSAILVDPDNSEEIAGAIIRVFENEALRRELATKGEKLVSQRFTWNQIAAETLKLYDELQIAK